MKVVITSEMLIETEIAMFADADAMNALHDAQYSVAILSYVADRDDSDKNKQKMQKVAQIANKANVRDMMKACNVSLVRFDSRAMYATEKCVKIIDAALNDSAFNDNALATIKTALLCADANVNLTFADIECAMSKDIKIADARSAYVYRRNALQSAATVNAQSQQCRDMLLTLKIAKKVNDKTFSIDADNAFLKIARVAFAELTC